jgi:hypothetical protein
MPASWMIKADSRWMQGFIAFPHYVNPNSVTNPTHFAMDTFLIPFLPQTLIAYLRYEP